MHKVEVQAYFSLTFNGNMLKFNDFNESELRRKLDKPKICSTNLALTDQETKHKRAKSTLKTLCISLSHLGERGQGGLRGQDGQEVPDPPPDEAGRRRPAEEHRDQDAVRREGEDAALRGGAAHRRAAHRHPVGRRAGQDEVQHRAQGVQVENDFFLFLVAKCDSSKNNVD